MTEWERRDVPPVTLESLAALRAVVAAARKAVKDCDEEGYGGINFPLSDLAAALRALDEVGHA